MRSIYQRARHPRRHRHLVHLVGDGITQVVDVICPKDMRFYTWESDNRHMMKQMFLRYYRFSKENPKSLDIRFTFSLTSTNAPQGASIMTKNNNPSCLTPFLRLFEKKAHEYALVRTSLPEDKPEVLPYFVRDDFLSGAEASFFRVLRSMTGENLIVCPKVSLADIFYVSRPDINMSYYNKINRKHVDFLLCSPSTLKPVLAIEWADTILW